MAQVPDQFVATQHLLEKRIILVTGATGGFGRMVSLACARHGASVILLSKNVAQAEALYDEIETSGYPTPAIYPMNFAGASEQDYRHLGHRVGVEFGRLDGLIHCAATLGTPTPFEHSDAEVWYRVHQVNLHAPYFLTRTLLPLLKQSAQASVVFMLDAKTGCYWDAYAVSKNGLAAMADLLAREYTGSSVHVNCVDPGKTKTGLHLQAYPAADDVSLPEPAVHRDIFLYLMAPTLTENGQRFVPIR